MFIATAKSIIGIAASLGAGHVVNNVIKATTPYNISKTGKILTVVGGVVLSTLVGDKAGDFAETKLIEMADQVNDVITEAKVKRSKLKVVK